MPRTGLSAEGVKEIAMQLAVEAMQKKGFDKLRLTEIAKEMRVTHAALYAHFADRAALFDAVTERWLRDVEQSLGDVVQSRKVPAVKIREWFLLQYKLHRERAMKEPELYKAFAAAADDQRKLVISHQKVLSSHLAQFALEAATKKQFKKMPAHSVAGILLEATRSYHQPQLILACGSERREARLNECLDVLLRGLAK